MSDLIPGEGELAALGGGGSPGIAWNDARLDALLSSAAALRPVAATGFAGLDAIIGGWAPGVSLVAAPPAAGKSTWVLQSLDHVARFSGRKAVFASLEMPAGSLVVKSLSRLSGELDGAALTFGEIMRLTRHLGEAENPRVDLLRRSIELYKREIAPNVATLDDCASVDDLLRVFESMPPGEPMPVCAVDYLQCLRLSGSEGLSDYQEVSRIMASLCELAKAYRVPVVAICSENRTSKRNTTDFANLAGSSLLEYGANQILFLGTDDSELSKPFVRNVRLTVAKSKYTGTGAIDLQLRPATSTFAELGNQP